MVSVKSLSISTTLLATQLGSANLSTTGVKICQIKTKLRLWTTFEEWFAKSTSKLKNSWRMKTTQSSGLSRAFKRHS